MNKDLRKFAQKWIQQIPDFIDTNSATHHFAFDCLQECLITATKLIKNTFVDNYTLWNIIADINSHIDTIDISCDDDKLTDSCRDHILYTLRTFEAVSAASEAYEAAQNLKRLHENLFTTKIKKVKK